jgi:hypothetical protein
MRTDDNNMVTFVKLCIVMGPVQSESISIGETIGSRPPVSHAWTVGTGDRLEEGSIPLSSYMSSGNRGSVIGFAGYNVAINTNWKVMLRAMVYGRRGGGVKYGTYGTAHPVELYFTYVLFKPDDYKVFSDSCAEVFSQCNFEGDSFMICEDNRDIPGSGFAGSVRSISLPSEMSLILYNRVDL